MPAGPPTEAVLPPRRSAGVAACLGWILPGLGQVYVGRPAKGFLYFVVIGSAYAVGLWLSGWTCVNPERDPIWFAAQALAGGPTALAAWLTRGLQATERMPTYDVGLLYVTVSALLNAVAVSDALGTVNEYQVAWRQARAEWWRAEAERQATEAAAMAAATEGGATSALSAEMPPPPARLATDGPEEGRAEPTP